MEGSLHAERRQLRTPVAVYANEIGARHAELAFVTSLSLNGLFGHAISRPWPRTGKRSLVEISLPGETEILRAIVERVHEDTGPLFRQTALRFVEMPATERERLSNWLMSRQNELEQIGL